METDQHPRRETRKWGWVSFMATPHLSSQGADPQTSRLAFSLHTHTHTHHRPQGPHHPSTLTGDVEKDGSL